jgi:hypothetical protein
MKVNVGHEEVELDPKVMDFTEATLNEYLMKDAGVYSYYHAKMVDAQYLAQKYEDTFESLYSSKFREFKEQGATDKLAEAMAKSDAEVVAAKEKVRISKRTKDHLWGFLKSLDKAHENALNLGYNVRKEMQVLKHNQVRQLDEIMN